MWFHVDYSSHVPVYKQIKEKIKELIVKGKLKEGQFVPSIRNLAKDIGVNVNTVARAYRELASEGVIKPVKGEGYVVAFLDSEEFLKKKIDEFRRVVLNLKSHGVPVERIRKVFEEVFGGDICDSQSGESGEEV